MRSVTIGIIAAFVTFVVMLTIWSIAAVAKFGDNEIANGMTYQALFREPEFRAELRRFVEACRVKQGVKLDC